jgi:putative DNA-invertase from lambdoid prophage Rac
VTTLSSKQANWASTVAAVRDLLARDAGISVIAKEIGLTRQTIYRIKEEPVTAEAALAAWRL